MEKLKTLSTLLEMSNEAGGIVSNFSQAARLRSLIAAIKLKAQQESKRLRRDNSERDLFNPTRYELCMIGIREEFTFGRTSRTNVADLGARLSRM